ncbi:nucleotidyl transferase AbiEii/AbiGii toxin family protein [Marinobacterium sp. D7]|uniref:nucleotidyl transferase AbiEii/AbiGii toxin family protein n=1 Tax=Marinobacterium ramblicola TaxID=2849041 RepID=UPI001C2D9B67|nr:nucleotidyl transferase AbiEii/AbiGii toxin family protein [Marinobacterium ramblicola]MBV1790680.1 nucleotidyl transferase AbiEii/AbiGii toxin family protein [Marinobacterium ramblicola]
MNLERSHHAAIWSVLSRLNPDFLAQNRILFGGGTRIALELDEYRESVDVDLFCVGKKSYKAARGEVTNSSFGRLFKPDANIERHANRDIRADRDAIRAFIDPYGDGLNVIKFEIISFDEGVITADTRTDLFPVPFISRTACYATKLLANADRWNNGVKDIIDICMMVDRWGAIPEEAWRLADDEYGEKVVVRGLEGALNRLRDEAGETIKTLTDSLKIESAVASRLVNVVAEEVRRTLVNRQAVGLDDSNESAHDPNESPDS